MPDVTWGVTPRVSIEDPVALGDESWRVREMALKVIARHHVDELLEEVIALRYDGTPRVRAAAQTAVVALTVPH